jgi:RimJ/RimL family protein N-acetyltransferase
MIEASADRGRGYATRGLSLALRYARSIGICQAEPHIAADNYPSRRVAEKAGFRLAGTFVADDGTNMTRYEVNMAQSQGQQDPACGLFRDT